MRKFFLLLLLLFFLIGCAEKRPFTEGERIERNIDSTTIFLGNNVAYIPLDIDGWNNVRDKDKIKITIATLDRFEQKYEVQVISWSFDIGNGGWYRGVSITFIHPQKNKTTQNLNPN